MYIDNEDQDSPIRPTAVTPSGRSMAVEDLDEAALATIEALSKTTSIPGLLARFSDIIWIARKITSSELKHQKATWRHLRL